MGKNKHRLESVDATAPQIVDAPVSTEPVLVSVETTPLNAEGYNCAQKPNAWVLEKAVLRVGLTGVPNKEAFYKAVKQLMTDAGVTTYQSSRYRGMVISDEKVKQRVDYVCQNLASKNKEHRWRLVDIVSNENGIKFVAQPAPVPAVIKVDDIVVPQ